MIKISLELTERYRRLQMLKIS